MDSGLLTTSQAASLCSVTPDTVLKWIRSGRLPARRTAGGHHRIARADLERLMQPGALQEEPQQIPERRRFRYCWEYNGNGQVLEVCQRCAVYLLRARRCYEMAKVAPEAVHPKVYCRAGCEECAYYKEVRDQEINVLVVTGDPVLTRDLRFHGSTAGFNLEIADCEYATSAVLNRFKADYIIVDCSLGRRASRDIIKHLRQDPRIPFVRLILAENQNQAPLGCEKEVFARIERPLRLIDISDCIEGIHCAGPNPAGVLGEPDRPEPVSQV